MIRSLRKWDPAATVWVLCLSEQCHRVLSELREPAVNLLRIGDLESAYPALAEARGNRSAIEFYFTCTPSLIRFVLSRVQDRDVVTYVDGDLYFFADPQPLFDELGGNSVSIIPHRFPKKLQYLEKYGLYNVGWMSFRNDPRGLAIVAWWQDRCNEWCYDVLDGDRFADQKYLDRIAVDFDGVVVLRHAGANLAPWNLGGHTLSRVDDCVIIDGKWPLIFFHFHGLRRTGKRIYIPGHFRYGAPFGRLIRARLYRPYIQHLEAISEETAGYFVAPTATLARRASKGAGAVERLIAWSKMYAKYALAMARGEFILAWRAGEGVRPSAISLAQGLPGEEGASLRIMVVHNYYGSTAPSGENNAVDAEIAMLRRAGHSVHTFTRMSDEIRESGWRGLMHGGMAYPWNPFEVFRFKKMLRKVKPDVVHIHNTFPLISPGILWAIRGTATAVITLHNYRLFCASGMLLRDGAICTRCLDQSSVSPALKYGCYRNSRIATLPVALSIALHRTISTWRSKVDATIAQTEFQRNRLVAAGLPATRLHLKTSFFSGSPDVVPWEKRSDVALFVGRLSPEKGIEYLVRAWLQMGSRAPILRIVGGGPLEAGLRDLVAANAGAKIQFLGSVPSDTAVREIAAAKLLIVPSICLEVFPVVLQEAFAAGTPCAVSDLGSLPTIVVAGINGLVFKERDSAAIAALIERHWADDGLLARLSAGARAAYEAKYTEDMNHRRLTEIYKEAIQNRLKKIA